ncbi:MAG TPA: GNAT family N-acetyltransferase [Pyrinomonadaceae bacterium]
MRSTAELPQIPSITLGREPEAASDLSVHDLSKGYETEVLDFLAVRSLHTVYMAGFIRDNGLESPLNRGTFYGCRNSLGQLLGVALIGHVTQIETRTSEALCALARAAQSCSSAHVIMGEKEKIEAFWNHYARAGQSLRLACRELLLEQCWPVEAGEEVSELRPATAADLSLVMPAQAEMALAECGVNPLEVDPAGFQGRCMRRVERGRVWVSVKDGRLAFKADIMAETPEVVYLEGVYVNPRERGKGYGRRCLLQLGRRLLSRSRSICLLVNERNTEAQGFYYGAGYRFRSLYETIYLHK